MVEDICLIYYPTSDPEGAHKSDTHRLERVFSTSSPHIGFKTHCANGCREVQIIQAEVKGRSKTGQNQISKEPRTTAHMTMKHISFIVQIKCYSLSVISNYMSSTHKTNYFNIGLIWLQWWAANPSHHDAGPFVLAQLLWSPVKWHCENVCDCFQNQAWEILRCTFPDL